MLEKQSNFKAWLYLAPALVLLIGFTFYPLLNAFYIVFLEDYNMLTGSASGYTFFGNFAYVLKDRLFLQALKNTVWIVGFSVPISVIIALIISVFLNSIKKFQMVFQTIFFLPYVTNAIAVGMAFAFIFNQDYGLFNMILGWFGIEGTDGAFNWVNAGASWGSAMFALLVFTVWGGLAFKIMVFLSGLQSIDKQYYDAARVDATPRWRVFSKITVPLLSPMIMYITITSFIGAFKAYRTVVGMFGPTLAPPGTLTKDSLITLVGLVYKQMDNIATMPGSASRAAAAAIILFFITLVFTGIQVVVSRKRVHY
jgi:multiple sugar transport system permease protein